MDCDNRERTEAALAAFGAPVERFNRNKDDPDFAADMRQAVLNLVADLLIYTDAEALDDPREIVRYALETLEGERD